MDRIQVVGSLNDAKRIFAEAEKGGWSLLLQSGTGLARFAGVSYVHSIMDEAATLYPNVSYKVIVDCEDDKTAALAAIRMQYAFVLFTGDEQTLTSLQKLGDALEVQVINDSQAALDLTA